MALHVTARFIARDDSRDALKNLLITLVEPIRNDPGCDSCFFIQNTAQPNEFVFIEVWKGKAELDRHLADEAVTRAIEDAEPLLDEAVELKIYEPLA